MSEHFGTPRTGPSAPENDPRAFENGGTGPEHTEYDRTQHDGTQHDGSEHDRRGPGTTEPAGSFRFGSAPGGSTLASLRRSRTDRKVAGLAGGIGRALGVDPVVIRVALAVLTLFGGFGIVLYAVGWLVVPDDGDQVSAVHALLGRGRSSVPPALAVLLVLLALGGAGTVFSLGVPFWPLLIAAGLVWWFGFARGGRAHRWNTHAERDARRWGRTDRWDEQSRRWGEQAQHWGKQAERWVHAQGWSSGQGPAPRRGTDDAADPGSAGPGSAGADLAGADLAGADPLAARTTPPAWDPLGVAPFAWDLPEPTPLAPPAPARLRGRMLTRGTLAVALLAMAGAAATVLVGSSLPWAAVTAVGLAVLAVGMLVTALRGRSVGALVGPAVILSVLTLGLGVTGLTGTAGFGDSSWQPTAANLSSDYRVQVGSGRLDLRQIRPAAGQTLTTQLTVRAGQATVLIPAGTTVELSCQVAAGQADCLNDGLSGVHRSSNATYSGANDQGTLRVLVQVDGGYVDVRRG